MNERRSKVYSFFLIRPLLQFEKMQIPNGSVGSFLFICVATRSLRFGALTSVDALFYFEEENEMKKKICFVIMLMLLFCVCALCACHEHTFSEWVVTKQPTCTQVGQKVRDCECGES